MAVFEPRMTDKVIATLCCLLQGIRSIRTTSVLLLTETTFCLEYDMNSTAASEMEAAILWTLYIATYIYQHGQASCLL